MVRILVVEDDPQSLKLTTLVLRSHGHEVIPAGDAVQASTAIAAQTPDLILMDLALPGKDGYALTRELRARPATARIPILAVSAFAMPGDAEKALAAGCTDYLTKPIRRETLLARVQALLGERPAFAATSAPGPGAGPGLRPTSEGGPVPNRPKAPAAPSVTEVDPVVTAAPPVDPSPPAPDPPPENGA